MKEAKDDVKKGAPQYYFTSDIQEQVSADAVMKAIMNQTISLSLRDIIGISPILQKKFNEVTKTRREYTTKSGEYELYSPEVEYSLAQANSGGYSETRRTLYIPDADEFQSFMVRYSNAVQLRPTKMLAMTTGTFTAKLCGPGRHVTLGRMIRSTEQVHCAVSYGPSEFGQPANEYYQNK